MWDSWRTKGTSGSIEEQEMLSKTWGERVAVVLQRSRLFHNLSQQGAFTVKIRLGGPMEL